MVTKIYVYRRGYLQPRQILSKSVQWFRFCACVICQHIDYMAMRLLLLDSVR